jgi:hypothetical protein
MILQCIVAILGFLGIICVYYEMIVDWTNHIFLFGVTMANFYVDKSKVDTIWIWIWIEIHERDSLHEFIKKNCNIHIVEPL